MLAQRIWSSFPEEADAIDVTELTADWRRPGFEAHSAFFEAVARASGISPRALELSRGNKHSNFNVPFVTLGSPGGYFKTGRYVRFARASENPYKFKGRSETELYTEILRSLGVGQGPFGEPEFFKEEMSILRA